MKSITVKQYLGVEVYVDVLVPDAWSDDDITDFAQDELSLRITADFAEDMGYHIGTSIGEDEDDPMAEVYGLSVNSVTIDEASWERDAVEETK